MIELKADLWDDNWELRCITTNGTIKTNGQCVMGRGVALQAQIKVWGLPKAVGKLIKKSGNHVYYVPVLGGIATFPVKHNWWEVADLDLIKQSTIELLRLVNTDLKHLDIQRVALPRPGCGNGRLNWDQVKPIVSLLDDRFYVITK